MPFHFDPNETISNQGPPLQGPIYGFRIVAVVYTTLRPNVYFDGGGDAVAARVGLGIDGLASADAIQEIRLADGDASSTVTFELLRMPFARFATVYPPTGSQATNVQGAGASGAALLGNPLLVAGSDGADARTLSTDNTGKLNVILSSSATGAGAIQVQGTAANGAATAGNPVWIAGYDVVNNVVRRIAVDGGGNVQATMQGGNSLGAVSSCNVTTGGSACGRTAQSLLVGGTDGTNAQPIATDTAGRIIVTGGLSDGATGQLPGLPTMAWDGTDNWQVRAQGQSHAAIVDIPAGWSLTSAPGAQTLASASRAAGSAGVRNVLVSLTATLDDTAAAVNTAIVRDGASGVGAILWQARLRILAATTGVVAVTTEALAGSTATAMTVEFLTAPSATGQETISATGFQR